MGVSYNVGPSPHASDRVLEALSQSDIVGRQSYFVLLYPQFALASQSAIFRTNGKIAERQPEDAVLSLVQDLGADTRTADIDISGHKFDFIRSIRVFTISAWQREHGEDEHCIRTAEVRLGSYGAQGKFSWESSGYRSIPAAHTGLEGYGGSCPHINQRSVFIEWRDHTGRYGFEQVNY